MKSKKKSLMFEERVGGKFSTSYTANGGTQQNPSPEASISNHSSASEDYRVAKRRILMNTPAHPSMKKSLLQMPDGYANATQIYTQQPLLPTLASHERTAGGQHQFAYNPEVTTFSANSFRGKVKNTKRGKYLASLANESATVPIPVDREDIARQLRALIGTVCGSSEEKYLLLKKRDELMCKARIKNTDVSVMRVVRGTCPDMCPEKERYRRETQKNLTQYECDPSGRIVPGRTVKDYSRSAADQEEPLPHELRPPHVLKMTMDYLIDTIARHIPSSAVDLARWYDFLWSRTRSIRKEISQQMLCDRNAVDLVEKCIRLHTFASFWMANLDVSDFDPKMNRENLSKCLQTLRHMYEDLASQGVVSPNEAEFRGYDMLLNLCDSNVHSYVCAYRNEVCMSPQVQLALVLAASLQGNNYVKFFRILKNNADFLQICLCHQYLSVVRLAAMETICKAYKLFPLDKFMEVFAFEKEKEANDFLTSFGIKSDGADSLELANGKLAFEGKMPQPESLTVGHCSWVLQKIKSPSLAEVLCNGQCAAAILPYPVNSFDENGRYIRDPFNNFASYDRLGRIIQRSSPSDFITID